MTTVACSEAHTPYQADGKDKWRCPDCGADNASFYVVGSANDECEKIHKTDEIDCQSCGYGGSGTKVMNALAKRDLRKTCSACKGEGTVPSKTPDPIPHPKKGRMLIDVCVSCQRQIGHALNCPQVTEE
jgi:hypothetical protein